MIAMKLQKDGAKDTLMLVLEPGNLERLKEGRPITKNLGQFLPGLDVDLLIGYTPDAVWLGQQLVAGKDLVESLMEGMKRPPNMQGVRASEDLTKVEMEGDRG